MTADHKEILQLAFDEVMELPDSPLETCIHHFGAIARRIAGERSLKKVRCVRCGAEKLELGPKGFCTSCLRALEQEGKLTIE